MGYTVASQDEATFGLIPWVVRGWARKGSRPIAHQAYQHKCIHIFGARSKREFVYSFSKKQNQRCFVAFLEKLSKRWGKVLLFIDNAPWHKGKLVNEFMAAHADTFKIEYFLKYCPELNPVEPCWKPARKTVGNRMVGSISTMKYHLKKVFDDPFSMPKMFQYLSY